MEILKNPVRSFVRVVVCTALAAACAVAANALTPADYPAVPGIVDVSNRGWPRAVESAEGVVRLEAPPQRVLALSLGHDEMLLALLSRDRFAGVGSFAADPTYSNVADLVGGMTQVQRGVENVLAAKPDVVVVSKYTKADMVALIKEAGVPVVRSALENSAAGNIPNILLLGYLLGVEERALELVAEIERRLAVVSDRVPPADDSVPARGAGHCPFCRVHLCGRRRFHRGRHHRGGRRRQRGRPRRHRRPPDQ